jgi:hypothetical protein
LDKSWLLVLCVLSNCAMGCDQAGATLENHQMKSSASPRKKCVCCYTSRSKAIANSAHTRRSRPVVCHCHHRTLQ